MLERGFMDEKWKPVEGYEGRYEVSDQGRVKSYLQDKEGKIKIGNKTHKGYRSMLLYNENGEKKWTPVHKMVANAFIENPDNLPQINHKDENKENNKVDNLEWCTNSYNHNYGTRNERASMSNRCCPTTSKKVYSVDSDGNITIYESIGEAERVTGNSHCNIVRALKGRTHHCGGLQWFYY